MNKYDFEKNLDSYYCKTFKESCLICYTKCDDGTSDCIQCDDSVEGIINRK